MDKKRLSIVLAMIVVIAILASVVIAGSLDRTRVRFLDGTRIVDDCGCSSDCVNNPARIDCPACCYARWGPGGDQLNLNFPQ